MKNLIKRVLLIPVLVIGVQTAAQEGTYNLEHFEKVIISPHIEATLVEGNEEKVVIENIDLPIEKLNVVVEGRTLRIYLDGAKSYTKTEKTRYEGQSSRHPLYTGTMVTAVITYKTLEKLSVRGEERIVLDSGLDQSDFELSVYGESEVWMSSVNLSRLKVTLYGESRFTIEEGEASYQKYIAYGESEVNTLKMESANAKITAYGEGEFMLSVSERIKVTAYGEAEVEYKGGASVDKGIVLGEATIRKIS